MDFKTLHEDWKTLSPGPFTEPEDEAIYKEFMKTFLDFVRCG